MKLENLVKANEIREELQRLDNLKKRLDEGPEHFRLLHLSQTWIEPDGELFDEMITFISTKIEQKINAKKIEFEDL